MNKKSQDIPPMSCYFVLSIPVNKNVPDTYWRLKRTVFKVFPLIDVTSSNLRDMVFGIFDRLAECNEK